MNKIGKVYLVGAGIGSEEYITVKGKKILEEADVIVYDRLLNQNLVDRRDKSKEFINVGKQASNHVLSQDEINEILVRKSSEGKTVVRLKGGDPYVFGRGGEEAEYLTDRGIEFEVVPGITSGIAGLCFAGIPITHRDYGSSLHLITGHKKNEDDLDYDTLSKLNGTMVFYMGLANLKRICEGLIASGKNPDTCCAVISHAGYPDQKVVSATLCNIDEDVKNEDIKSPSLIVVGDVVKLREKLNFFENRPLFGKNVVVTRAREQSSSLVGRLKNMGANVIEVPAIAIKQINLDKLKFEIENIRNYTHLIFTSANGVRIFMEALFENHDARALGSAQILAMGDGTAGELKKYGINADFVPSKFVAETFYEEMKDMINSEDTILMPRALKARTFLCDKLSEICEVKEIFVYDTVSEEIDCEEREVLKNLNIDYITFTSSSTVENFANLIDDEISENIKGAKIISIGPITSKAAENNGFNVYREAKIYNIENLVKAIIE